jgi:pyruvate dehydrogenase E1 component beta subunit
VTDVVNGELFGRLHAPPHRITTPDTPVPYAAALEEAWLPSASYIRDQIDELLVHGRRPAPWWHKAQETST